MSEVAKYKPHIFREQEVHQIREAFLAALLGRPDAAARQVSEILANYTSFSVFMADSNTLVSEDAIFLGHGIGTIFLSGSAGRTQDSLVSASITLKSAYQNDKQFEISGSVPAGVNIAILQDNIIRFFVSLEHDLNSLGQDVSRAVSVNRMVSPKEQSNHFPSRKISNFLRSSALTASILMAGFGLGIGVDSTIRLSAPASERQAPHMGSNSSSNEYLQSNYQASAVDQAGIGGVVIHVGGYGAGQSSDLSAFGIKPGPEVESPTRQTEPD